MDQPHDGAAAAATAPTSQRSTEADTSSVPQDDDERFIVGLVLTYYRRHPQRARARLLDLLGEVLSPAPPTPPKPGNTGKPADDPQDLWVRTQAGVAPLKRKR
jgi:hypothetical protein